MRHDHTRAVRATAPRRFDHAKVIAVCDRYLGVPKVINPFSTAVPFQGQTTQISSSLSPERDCGTTGVKPPFYDPP